MLMRCARILKLLPLTLIVLVGLGSQEETAVPSAFTEHLISADYRYAYGLAAADLDGDGDLDLTSSDVTAGEGRPSSLYWFENDGKGSFKKHVIHQGEPGWCERHAIGDITGDGKPEVAVVNNRDGQVVWFENSGKPAAGPWKRRVITTKAPRAYDVVLVDIDGDGLLDAAVSGYASNLATWYRNPGKDGWDAEWPRHIVGDHLSEVRTIRVGDFNRDGKPDLLCASVGVENVPVGKTDVRDHGSSIVWFENPGKPATQPWKKHVINATARAPIHGQPIDLDGDGDLDVVMAHGMRKALIPEEHHEIAWYENVGAPGAGSEWKRHVIGKMPCAFEAIAVDLNGDGKPDVAATSWALGDRVAWFENPGDPRGTWKMHVLKEKWFAANQIIAADLDGDKRPDLAATADDGSRRVKGANELRWWRNRGTK